ncbi:MAG: ABC transporter substrate-binding protein [Candidatus Dormibacteria bacterium]
MIGASRAVPGAGSAEGRGPSRPRPASLPRFRASLALAAGLGLVAALLASCGASPGGGGSSESSGPGVLTFAEQPQEPPTYILPLESSAEESNANFAQFSNILYPGLYVFDANGKPELDQRLSVGEPPKFSDGNTVVTITLKHWQWSNGEPVTARDLVFWMNLLSAVTDPSAPSLGSSAAPGPGYGFFVPGNFPENVTSYSQAGKYTLVLHLNRAYNPTWFLYNELSEITPIPQATWDKTSASANVGDADMEAQARVALPGTSPSLYVPGNPGTATTGALGVAQFLNTEAQDLATYSRNPLWRVVDGAFKMTDYTQSGFVKLVPNARYSGTPKPTIKAFEEMPFTTDSAEALAVRSGKLTIGYLLPSDLGARAQFQRAGDYAFAPWDVYGIGYASYNFTNPVTGPLFRQLYIRQALQSLVNQPQYITQFLGGYATQTQGPVPSHPAGPYTSPMEKGGPPYPYNPTRARRLLSSHGWTVKRGGASYCARPGTGPGECGAGISLNQDLALGMTYASGNSAGANMVQALQSTARQQAGVAITPQVEPFSQVIGTEFAGCTTSSPCSNWDLANLFVGWTYGPDYLPTGGEIFGTGAGSNAGYYTSSANDANIAQTHTASTQAQEVQAMYRYQDYLTQQLPVLWMPSTPLQLTLYKKSLKGLVPQGIIDQVFPQFYR